MWLIVSKAGLTLAILPLSVASAHAWPTMPVKPSNQPPLGITMGDASGIGPELVVRLFAKGLPYPAVVFGDAGQLRRAAQQLGLDKDLAIDTLHTPSEALKDNTIPVVACHPDL